MPDTSAAGKEDPGLSPEPPGDPAGAEAIEESDDFCYRDDLDYLDDLRMLFLERGKARPAMAGRPGEPPGARDIRATIERRRERARRAGVELRLEDLAERFRLDETEKLLVAALVIRKVTGHNAPFPGDQFFRAISEDAIRGLIDLRRASDRLAEKRLVTLERIGRLPGSPEIDDGVLKYVTGEGDFPGDPGAAEPEEKPVSARELAVRARERFPRPRDLHRELARRVVGQDSVLRTLSVAACDHLARIAAGEPPEKGTKKNVLLAGPTGCGKTHIVTTLAGLLGLPCAVGDATSWTEEGYVGMSFDEVFYRLYRSAGSDREKAQTGIVFIDEVDKLAAGDGDGPGRPDVGGGGVQRALLKALDGGTIPISPGGSHTWRSGTVEFDTSPTLIILGGAFTGIERIVEERRRERGIGFGAGAGQNGRREPPGTDDLVRYGLLREFAGRIPVVALLARLTGKELVRILSRGEHSLLAAVNREARRHGLAFSFTAGALEAIAADALEKGTGARSLRGTLNRVTEPHIFAKSRTGGMRTKEIRITARDIAGALARTNLVSSRRNR